MATALTAAVMRPKTEKTIFDGFRPGTFSHSLDPELTCCAMPSQLFRLRQKVFKDIAPFTPALMLKMLADGFDHWSASVCRLRF